jgi:hypothetical protein
LVVGGWWLVIGGEGWIMDTGSLSEKEKDCRSSLFSFDVVDYSTANSNSP